MVRHVTAKFSFFKKKISESHNAHMRAVLEKLHYSTKQQLELLEQEMRNLGLNSTTSVLAAEAPAAEAPVEEESTEEESMEERARKKRARWRQ
eukprot:SAG31_NODE_156_length_22055_cov_105.227728_22_plen_93_part_00